MFNGYFTGIIGRVRQVALVAAIGGPAAAGYGFYDSNEIRQTLQRGAEATAVVNHMTENRGRRGSRSYTANVTWQDQGGAERSGDLHITDEFAQRYIVGDSITLSEVAVRYLPDNPQAKPIVADDANLQMGEDDTLIKFGAGAGGIGILGSILLFLFRGRRKPEETAEGTS